MRTCILEKQRIVTTDDMHGAEQTGSWTHHLARRTQANSIGGHCWIWAEDGTRGDAVGVDGHIGMQDGIERIGAPALDDMNLLRKMFNRELGLDNDIKQNNMI
jgi:hypothetical protein